jgi:hypothetical protein
MKHTSKKRAQEKIVCQSKLDQKKQKIQLLDHQDTIKFVDVVINTHEYRLPREGLERYPESLLSVSVSSDIPLQTDSRGRFSFSRPVDNPDLFSFICSIYGNNGTPILPEAVHPEQLYAELDYWQLPVTFLNTRRCRCVSLRVTMGMEALEQLQHFAFELSFFCQCLQGSRLFRNAPFCLTGDSVRMKLLLYLGDFADSNVNGTVLQLSDRFFSLLAEPGNYAQAVSLFPALGQLPFLPSQMSAKFVGDQQQVIDSYPPSSVRHGHMFCEAQSTSLDERQLHRDRQQPEEFLGAVCCTLSVSALADTTTVTSSCRSTFLLHHPRFRKGIRVTLLKWKKEGDCDRGDGKVVFTFSLKLPECQSGDLAGDLPAIAALAKKVERPGMYLNDNSPGARSAPEIFGMKPARPWPFNYRANPEEAQVSEPMLPADLARMAGSAEGNFLAEYALNTFEAHSWTMARPCPEAFDHYSESSSFDWTFEVAESNIEVSEEQDAALGIRYTTDFESGPAQTRWDVRAEACQEAVAIDFSEAKGKKTKREEEGEGANRNCLVKIQEDGVLLCPTAPLPFAAYHHFVLSFYIAAVPEKPPVAEKWMSRQPSDGMPSQPAFYFPNADTFDMNGVVTPAFSNDVPHQPRDFIEIEITA